MKYTRSSTIIVPVLVLAACAGKPEPRAPQSMAELRGGFFARPTSLVFAAADANADLKVSRDEVNTALRAQFTAADSDADGGLSAFELAAWAQSNLGDETATPGRITFDRDGNGAVSQEEFLGHFGLVFARADQNRDGFLERAELVQRLELPTRPEGAAQRPRPGGGRMPR